jgi:hypothetical protein
MSVYNIIYTSPDKDTYLWNGTGLDKLTYSDREVLFYSGRSIKEDTLFDALKVCKEKVKQLFPEDTDPEIESVAVKVSS